MPTPKFLPGERAQVALFIDGKSAWYMCTITKEELTLSGYSYRMDVEGIDPPEGKEWFVPEHYLKKREGAYDGWKPAAWSDPISVHWRPLSWRGKNDR